MSVRHALRAIRRKRIVADTAIEPKSSLTQQASVSGNEVVDRSDHWRTKAKSSSRFPFGMTGQESVVVRTRRKTDTEPLLDHDVCGICNPANRDVHKRPGDG